MQAQHWRDIIVDLWLIKSTTQAISDEDADCYTKNEAIISFKCPTVVDGKHNNSVVIILSVATTSLNFVCLLRPNNTFIRINDRIRISSRNNIMRHGVWCACDSTQTHMPSPFRTCGIGAAHRRIVGST